VQIQVSAEHWHPVRMDFDFLTCWNARSRRAGSAKYWYRWRWLP